MKRKYLMLLSLSGLIIACDQLTKQLVNTYLLPGASIPFLKSFFSLTYLKNSGFAFGLMPQAPQPLKDIIFIAVPVFALILIVMIFIKLRDDQIMTSVALTTILAGAIGNLIDRLLYGYVIDFLEFQSGLLAPSPAFNIADCSILTGVGLMFMNTLIQGRVKSAV